MSMHMLTHMFWDDTLIYHGILVHTHVHTNVHTHVHIHVPQDDALIYHGVLDNTRLRATAEQATGAPQRLSDANVLALKLADRKFEHYGIERELGPGRVWKVRRASSVAITL